MSALDNLLDEVRLEAEQVVRTEYENTVIELRGRVTDLEKEVTTLTKDRNLWRDAEKKIGAKYDDLLDTLGQVIRQYQ